MTECPNCGGNDLPVTSPFNEWMDSILHASDIETGDCVFTVDCRDCEWSQEYRVTGEVVTSNQGDGDV